MTVIQQVDTIYKTRLNYDSGYVYKIVNKITGKVYIGSTIDIYKREISHFSALRANRHANRYLQNSWNKYGENAFYTEEIECVLDVSKLAEREQYYMDLYQCYDDRFGYNINKSASSSLGRPVSKETRFKISQAHIKANRTGEKSYWFGKKMSDKTKEKMSKIHKGKTVTVEMRKNMSEAHIGVARGIKNPMSKLNESQVKEIKLLWKFVKMTALDISRYFPITRSGVNNIIHKGEWSHVSIEDTKDIPQEVMNIAIHNEISTLLRNKEGVKRAFITYFMLKDILVLLESNSMTIQEISKLFFVKNHAIWSIKNGRTFKDEVVEISILKEDVDRYKEIVYKYESYNKFIVENRRDYYL